MCRQLAACRCGTSALIIVIIAMVIIIIAMVIIIIMSILFVVGGVCVFSQPGVTYHLLY